MEKKYQHYRTEGTAALKVTVLNEQTPIIPFNQNSLSNPKLQENQQITSKIKAYVANDPLFGSIKKAELSFLTYNLSANKDHQVFIKGTFLTTLFALVVILIGA